MTNIVKLFDSQSNRSWTWNFTEERFENSVGISRLPEHLERFRDYRNVNIQRWLEQKKSEYTEDDVYLTVKCIDDWCFDE